MIAHLSLKKLSVMLFGIGLFAVTPWAWSAIGCISTQSIERYSDHNYNYKQCNCPCDKGYKLSKNAKNMCPECGHEHYAKSFIFVSSKQPILKREPFAAEKSIRAYSSGKTPVEQFAQHVAACALAMKK